MGQCNVFQNHMKDLSLIVQLLHILTWNNSNYLNEQMLLKALQAIYTIKNSLISEKVVTFPRADCLFALVSGVSMPTDQHRGGMFATFFQVKSDGSFQVLSRASCLLESHEANYSPFLLEMANTIYGM